MSTDGEGFDKAAEEMALLRKESGDDAVPMGYTGAAQSPLGVKGDQQGPFLKIPPFPEPPTSYANQLVLPPAGFFGPRIDTTKHRILSLWFAYLPVTDDSRLSIFPFAFDENLGFDVAIGTVDATLTVGVPPVLGQRNIYQTELRTNLVASGTGIAMTLDFQCAAYKAMRFFFLERVNPNDGGLLNADISSSE